MSGVTLILGGARSGKSAFAERLALESGRTPVYLATAQAFDDEMDDRIAHHKARRGSGWLTIEEPLAIAEAIEGHRSPDTVILVDCLTLWLANLHADGRDVADEFERLGASLAGGDGPVVLVSNELGLGIVPERASVRAYRDDHGRMNQAMAEFSDTVIFMAAGQPLRLKPSNDQDFSL